MNVKMLCDYSTGHAVTVNKYKVHSDAMVDVSSNKGSLEVVHFYTLFRGECKADLHVNLVRQFLALEVYFLKL